MNVIKLAYPLLLSTFACSSLGSSPTSVAPAPTAAPSSSVPVAPSSAAPAAPSSPAPAPLSPVARTFLDAVHPMCFWSNDREIELAGCDQDANGQSLAGKLERTPRGRSFTPVEPALGHGSRYQVLGEGPGGVVVSYVYNSGGSGNFSGLGVYQLDEAHVVEKQAIHAGDRCHNGVRDAWIEGETLFYRVSLTPAAVIRLGGQDLSVGAYKLSDGAAICAGTVSFEMPLATGASRPVAVELQPTAGADSCFDEILATHLGRWHGSPGDAELTALAEDYADHCKDKE